MKEFNIDPSHKSEWNLFNDRTSMKSISNSKSTLVSSNLKHGDMIFLMPVKNVNHDAIMEDESKITASVEIDEVDLELEKQNGQIIRSKDNQL